MFLMVSFSHASENTKGAQKLASIVNDEDGGVIVLEILTDHYADITHLKLVYKDERQMVTDNDLYTANKAAAGVVLYKVDNLDVVKLRSPNFSTHQGGEIILDYLVNGVTGSRALKKLDISRNGDVWSLNEAGKKIKKLHFVSNKKAFIGTIGIKEIKSY